MSLYWLREAALRRVRCCPIYGFDLFVQTSRQCVIWGAPYALTPLIAGRRSNSVSPRGVSWSGLLPR